MPAAPSGPLPGPKIKTFPVAYRSEEEVSFLSRPNRLSDQNAWESSARKQSYLLREFEVQTFFPVLRP